MDKIKTLLERAKPEVLEALKSTKEDFPFTHERISKYLNENYFISDMPWSIWIDLRSSVVRKTKVLANDPWDLFQDL